MSFENCAVWGIEEMPHLEVVPPHKSTIVTTDIIILSILTFTISTPKEGGSSTHHDITAQWDNRVEPVQASPSTSPLLDE
jgi:hypothetical protein